MTESDGRDIAVLTADRIDISAVIDAVRDDGAGAISTFIGTTRNTFEGALQTAPSGDCTPNCYT
jgi:molybdopterin synthase catalytic subunit